MQLTLTRVSRRPPYRGGANLITRNRITVGAADDPDAARAGHSAVAQALRGGPGRPPDCALLFATSRHDPVALDAAVRGALPAQVPVYGGYAVGVISADTLGYDGFQVGLALVWLDGARLDVLVGRDLNKGEGAVGEELVQRLCELEFEGLPSLLLLYDSVNRTGDHFRFNMATPLLAGLSGLPPEVPLVGAGLVGDMQCRPTHQWTGAAMETQTAMLLAFSGNLEIEQVVLHGCRPGGAYHEITKVDGTVVLEIDGRPALQVVADLLGPGADRSWREYAFFVTLGVNKGEKYGAFDPDLYVNRMCLGIDATRAGLLVGEPDLRAGDLVQLMLRGIDYAYIGDKISTHLAENAHRTPVFALYIDCAGRASAYSHLEEEEATYVQAALKDVCPLLGLYSGIEVARIGGSPQPLDWTGVLALFYERDPVDAPSRIVQRPAAALPARALVEDEAASIRDAVGYYERHLDHAAGEQVRFDARLSALNHRLRQKDEGFRALADLRKTIDVRLTIHQIYHEALGMLLSSMALGKALVLEGTDDGPLTVIASAGYAEDEAALLADLNVELWDLDSAGFLIGNRADTLKTVERLRRDLHLPCFVAVPFARARGRAVLVVGREREIKPFFPPFDAGDVANFQAIANFLSSVVDNVQLYGEAEEMAASFRRFVPEAFLKIINRTDFKDIALGDQVARHMAVLVTDIRSFTTLSERMTPAEVFTFVNEFLAEVGPVVRKHEGFVNKYIGDAVMALFEQADDGLHSAVALIRQIENFNDRRRLERKFPIQVGVAVNSGDLMLGAIGEAERLEGSVLADAVNLCFRLESLTKTYGAQILTTNETLDELPDRGSFLVRPVDLVTVKGRRTHVTVMEVLDGLPEERLEKRLATHELFTAAFQSFEFGAYEEAARIFREVAQLDPDDRAARAMGLKARKLAEGEAL